LTNTSKKLGCNFLGYMERGLEMFINPPIFNVSLRQHPALDSEGVGVRGKIIFKYKNSHRQSFSFYLGNSKFDVNRCNDFFF